jgi:hypothetical protein
LFCSFIWVYASHVGSIAERRKQRRTESRPIRIGALGVGHAEVRAVVQTIARGRERVGINPRRNGWAYHFTPAIFIIITSTAINC